MISVTIQNVKQASGTFCNNLVVFLAIRDPKIFLMNPGKLIGRWRVN